MATTAHVKVMRDLLTGMREIAADLRKCGDTEIIPALAMIEVGHDAIAQKVDALENQIRAYEAAVAYDDIDPKRNRRTPWPVKDLGQK